ncbi:MAG TPA: response regulator [Anaerolineae bacterium]|nr:response regulator [Anaerolineae bacterium]
MRKILIIEDRRENIVFIANNILKPLGYDVITAMDGQTGLTKAQEEAPDLIISDLKLPGLGGLEVLEQLRKKGLNIPTIVMTFHGTEETAVRALRLGARDYLIKPFTVEEMHAALDRALKPASPPVTPPLRRLTTAPLVPKDPPAELARIPQLEQELAQMRVALATREKQLNQLQQLLINRNKTPEPAGAVPANAQPQGSGAEARTAQLEQELIQMRTVLAMREKQLRQIQQQLANSVQKLDMAEVAQRAATWEEDNARLNQVLAQTKQMLSEAEKRANTLEETVVAQKIQMSKYQEEAKRLADQLRNLSEAVRLLSQDLGQQVERIGGIASQEKR